MSHLLRQLNAELSGRVERVRQSLVRVSNGPSGAGAGVIWNSEGLIVTNAHVVHHAQPQVTLPDGRTQRARVLGHEPRLDLALLAVKAHSLPVLALRDTEDLRPGELVFAVGHPWGVTGAVTAGVVIGLGRDLPELAGTRREWLVANLCLRPGNSGGPLVDADGRLVGVNTIMTGPEVGGAVPAHVVRQFLAQALSA